MSKFLTNRRDAVVKWRYPFEEMSAVPEPKEFDDVLAVLVGVCEPGSAQARRIMEYLTAGTVAGSVSG